MIDHMNGKRTAFAFVVVSIMLVSGIVGSSTYSEGDETNVSVLLDNGNGVLEWTDTTVGSTDTLNDLFVSTVDGYSSSGGVITVGGLTNTVIGATGTGGTYSVSGLTGTSVSSQWHIYGWDAVNGEWVSLPASDLSSTCGRTSYALYFGAVDCPPVETPSCRDSWTMIRGDAEQSGDQETVQSSEEASSVIWTGVRDARAGVYSSVLYVQDCVIVKYGTNSGMSTVSGDAALRCYDLATGTLLWEFAFPGILYYETATPVIVGDYVYTTSGLGYIFKLPWKDGPGVYNANVRMLDITGASVPYDRDAVIAKTNAIPLVTGATLVGTTYSSGPGSLISDSGVLYFTCSNGMIYCLDLDLRLIWSYQTGGSMYYLSPTVRDGYLFTGALDGNLYAMNKQTGVCIDSKLVYNRPIGRDGNLFGSVHGVVPIKLADGTYRLMFALSDGRGMNTAVGGVGVYGFNGSALTRISVDTTSFGLVSNYVVHVSNSEFTGIYLACTNGLCKVDTTGRVFALCNSIKEIHAPPLLVNGNRIYLSSYAPGNPVYVLDLEGNILSAMNQPSSPRNYSMAPVLVVGDYMVVSNDSGLYVVEGVLPDYVPPVITDDPWWEIPSIIAVVLLSLVLIFYVWMRMVKKIEKPFAHLVSKYNEYIHSESYSHNAKSRHRLLITLVLGSVFTMIAFIACLSIGPSGSMSPVDALSSLFSAIDKGGRNLTYDEIIVYNSRFPRTVAALAVGIGLSIAGSIYQAIIRNPLVDPYIMGVSAGAGTAAVSVIAFDFTFFGLFSPHSIYLTAVTAMVGGILAFLITMLLAEKSGGQSINYVLAGVVVGLAFSAVQTLMISMAGHKVTDALTWLFGSFSNVSWNELGLIVFPAIALSLIPLLWAKEFNLVLLGEDQAKQMGLDVRRFNRMMLILASVLTSICVAFVGIIGFVGLVVPHFCRMILGGDHRLVMPTSIVLGGLLMMLADLASRMLLVGQELPVGAITTLIGVPVFAYLLIKRGRMYDG